MSDRSARDTGRTTVALIGELGHGKSTLLAAIQRVVDRDLSTESPTSRGRAAFLDWPTHEDFVKGMITGSADVDGVVLVVSADEGPGQRASQQLSLALQLGAATVVVFVNKVDLVPAEERLRSVEDEVRMLLADHGRDEGAVPMIRGSALEAAEAEPGAEDSGGLDALLTALDTALSAAEGAADEPFLMPVEDVFTIEGRGTVVTGRIERGAVRKGEEVAILGMGSEGTAEVAGVEMVREMLDEAQAGDNVGLLLRGVEKHEVVRGQVLARPGTIAPSTRFRAEVYVLSTEEGGRGLPGLAGYRPQFYFRSTDVSGSATLPAGVDSVTPGGTVQLDVELMTPVAMHVRQRFTIREGGRTVGAGIVTATAESGSGREEEAAAAEPPLQHADASEPLADVGPSEPLPDADASEPSVAGATTGGFGVSRSGGAGAEAEPPAPAQPAPTPQPKPRARRLFADLTLFDESGTNRIDDTADALCEGTRYWMEVALRGRRSGVKYAGPRPKPAGPAPAGAPARILVVVSGGEADFEVEEPVQFIHLPAQIEADSHVDARFAITAKRDTPLAEDLAELEVRLYYELNLIEHVVLEAEVHPRTDCAAGSRLALSPPIRIRQMEDVGRQYADIVRDLRPRHMSVDLRALNSGVRFSVTVSTGGDGASDVPAREVYLHGRSDIGTEDLTRAVNRVRDLWREVAMDRFAGEVDGSSRVFRDTLKDLALEGRDLWSLLFRGAQDSAMWNIGEWIKTHPPVEGSMVEVRMLDGAQTFVFPWALLYDGPDPRRSADVTGFWGLRYAIEQKPGKGQLSPDAATDPAGGLNLSFMVWDSFKNASDQSALLGDLVTESHGRLRVALPPVNDPYDFYDLVEDCDADILYFYAHGHTRPIEADAGHKELQRVRERFELLDEGSPQRAALQPLYDLITARDFEPDESWILLSAGRLYLSDLRARQVRLNRAPLVFLNMCESAQVLPGLADSFVTFFLDRHARSVIGTECPMTNQFAHPFSKFFLAELLRGTSVGVALLRARLHFMERKNPLGLAYTLFGSGTTRYEPAVLDPLPPSP